MTQTDKERAIRYALSLVMFQEIGMGKDENLNLVKEVVATIRALCLDETGYNLTTYPTEFLKENRKEAIKFLPCCVNY